MSEIVCVGCGPGDPELLTVKAVKAIKNAEVIICSTSKEGKPSIVYSSISSLIDGRYFDQVIKLLKEAGFPDSSIFAIGQDIGTDQEIIKKLTLGEVTNDTMTTKYFSIMVVKRA